MYKIILTAFLIVPLFCFSQQQDNAQRTEKGRLASLIIDTSYKHRGITFYATLPGVVFSGPVQLNSVLSNQQMPTLGKTVFVAGFGVEERWKWFAVGIDYTMGDQNYENARYSVRSNISLSNIYFKYYVIKTKDAGGVYPIVGITALSQSVYVTDKNNSNDINALFGNSGSTNLFLSTGFITTGIGIDLLNFTEEDAFYGSMKIGYRTNIARDFDNKWFVNDSRSLSGSPIERLNAFSIMLSVGYTFNHFSKKQKRIF